MPRRTTAVVVNQSLLVRLTADDTHIAYNHGLKVIALFGRVQGAARQG